MNAFLLGINRQQQMYKITEQKQSSVKKDWNTKKINVATKTINTKEHTERQTVRCPWKCEGGRKHPNFTENLNGGKISSIFLFLL